MQNTEWRFKEVVMRLTLMIILSLLLIGCSSLEHQDKQVANEDNFSFEDITQYYKEYRSRNLLLTSSNVVDFKQYHKQLYFYHSFYFKLDSEWLKSKSKAELCYISKSLALLPESLIIVNAPLKFPTHREFFDMYCPEILNVKVIEMNNLFCERNLKSPRLFECKWRKLK